MENITVGQIAVTIAFIVALLSGIAALKKSIKSGIEAALKDKFDSIEKSQKEKFESLEKSQAEILKRLDSVDLENCKNYLVTFLSEAARGEQKDETEIQRFWEEYEHYVSKGGNSYIKHKVDELKGRKLI